jgi:hypothetical protein
VVAEALRETAGPSDDENAGTLWLILSDVDLIAAESDFGRLASAPPELRRSPIWER